MEDLLDKTLRCTLSDGRFVVGTFQCLDKQRNFILTNCTETRRVKDEHGVECESKRNLGLVLVPGKHLVKAERQQKGSGERGGTAAGGNEGAGVAEGAPG